MHSMAWSKSAAVWPMDTIILVVLAVLQEFLFVLQCFRCQGDDLDDVGIWFEPGKSAVWIFSSAWEPL